jgi:hypothetical protein
MRTESVPTPSSARRGSEPVSSRSASTSTFQADFTTGAECKRHKIKCDPVDGEAKCAKCLRSGTECVPYNMNQRLLDEDAS